MFSKNINNFSCQGPNPAGSSIDLGNGRWNVTGSGYDIWGTSDSFHFLPFEKTNDITVTLFSESFENSHTWAKAGLMIRDTLDQNSAQASLFTTGAQYVAFQTRDVAGATSNNYHTNYGTHRVWLRLTKEGNTITAYVKNENDAVFKKFTTRSTFTFTGDNFFVGIPVTSHINGQLATLTASSFEISDEVFSLPTRDIGDVGRDVVTAQVGEGNWEVKGAGKDIGVSSIDVCRVERFSIK